MGGQIQRRTKKHSFSRFKNTEEDPIFIDLDDSIEELPFLEEINHLEQQPLHEPEDMIVDFLGADDPPTMESLPVMNTDTTSNEVVEVLMKELTMDEKRKHPTYAEEKNDDGMVQETVVGKKKGISPTSKEKKPKKLKSEPSLFLLTTKMILLGNQQSTLIVHRDEHEVQAD